MSGLKALSLTADGSTPAQRAGGLSQECVADVRRALEAGERNVDVARRLGIGTATISRIRTGVHGGRGLTVQDRFDSHYTPEPMSGCWLWTGFYRPTGYGQFIAKNIAPTPRNAHRFSYALHVGPIPDGTYVLHRCDNRACVNPAHLFLGSHQDNVTDMMRKGRNRPGGMDGEFDGERNPAAKLTRAQVDHIRVILSTGVVSRKRIANAFGVSRVTIGDIAAGKTWSAT